MPDTTLPADLMSVPIAPPSTPASTIVEVNLTPKPIKEVNIAEALGIPRSNIKGPGDIFGADEAPDAVNARIDAGIKERDSNGRFLPKDPAAKPVAAKPQPKPPVKPVAVIPPPEPKIKIGTEEKTAAEWQAFHKELADKAKPAEPVKPIEPAAPAAPQETDDQRRTAFIEQAAEHFAPSQEDFDAMLASGDVKAFGRMMARVAADAREWMVRTVSPHLDRFDSQLSPITRQQEEIQQYQAENQFLLANPDIKAITDADPTKLEVHRGLNQQLRQELDAMKMLAKQSPDNGWVKERAEAIEKDFLGELAKAARGKLGLNGAAPAPAAMPAPAATEPPKPKQPAERPLGGDRPGASSAPRGETNEARLAREIASI